MTKSSRYQDVSLLTTPELLALLLHEGPGRPSTALDAIFSELGSLRALFDASMEELEHVTGVGPARAARIRAILELAKRYATQPPEEVSPTDSR